MDMYNPYMSGADVVRRESSTRIAELEQQVATLQDQLNNANIIGVGRITALEAQVATLRELAQWAVDHGCSLHGGSSEAGKAYIAATELHTPGPWTKGGTTDA